MFRLEIITVLVKYKYKEHVLNMWISNNNKKEVQKCRHQQRLSSVVGQVQGSALVVEKKPLPPLYEVHFGGEILLAPGPALCLSLHLPSPSV